VGRTAPHHLGEPHNTVRKVCTAVRSNSALTFSVARSWLGSGFLTAPGQTCWPTSGHLQEQKLLTSARDLERGLTMDHLQHFPGLTVTVPALAVAAVAYWLLKRSSRTTLPLCSPVRFRRPLASFFVLTGTAGCCMALGTRAGDVR